MTRHFLLLAVLLASMCGAQVLAEPITRDGVTLSKLIYTDIDVGFQEQPAGEVLRFLFEVADVNARVLAIDKDHSSGVNLSQKITIIKADRPVLNLLQEVLAQCSETDPCTWQIRGGMVEVSSKERLATESMMVVRTTPVDDLLIEIPDYDDPPNLNLGGGGGGEGGGGGGGSGGGFGGGGGGAGGGGGIYEFQSREQSLEELINLLTRTVEPAAWERRGGTMASIQVFRNSLVIRAPRWVHRQIDGFGYHIPTPKGRTTRTLRASGDQIRVEVPLSERMKKQYDE